MVKFNNMKTVEAQALPAPPSLMASLMAGFDAITNQIGLILIPVALDLFLWMGARLRLSRLVDAYLKYLSSITATQAPETQNVFQQLQDFWVFAAERFNLFSILRSYPIGIPSLMASWQPAGSPAGIMAVFEASSFIGAFAFWLVITIAGLVLGTFFYLLVAQASLSGKVKWRRALIRLPYSTLQVIFLVLFWAILLLVISLPASCLLSMAAISGYALGQLGLFLFGGLVLWIIFPLFFSTHGIIVNHSKMWVSILDSIRITRYTMPKTALLFVVIFVIDEGMGMIWRIPDETSWFTLIGVLGHAFIASGLLAASFVYYRDAYRWVQRLLQEAKLSSLT